MSLVGTRPILPDELEQYELHHRARVMFSAVIPPSVSIGESKSVYFGRI